MPLKKVCCFIDGFNLYHSIVDIINSDPNFRNAGYLKWINLRSLASAFVKRREEELKDVLYFSALAYWLPESEKRHKVLIEANKENGVIPILGNFKKKIKTCPKCKAQYITHEEKQSDVNIAAYLTHYAHHNDFDTAFVMSADSDLCQAISLIRMRFPEKKITVLIPPGRGGITRELKNCASNHYTIKPKHLKNSLLPLKIITQAGEEINCPIEYKQFKGNGTG